MSATIPASAEERPRPRFNLAKHRGLIAVVVVFLALLAFVAENSPKGLGYYDIASLATNGAPLALAAIGETLIIIAGGFDLSAGAAISLVNAIVATTPQEAVAGQVAAVAAGLAVGAAIGAFNGFFVAFFGLQSIVVTLSTMFLVHGITLLVLPDPSGAVAENLTKLLTGAAIPGVLPASVVVIAGGLASGGSSSGRALARRCLPSAATPRHRTRLAFLCAGRDSRLLCSAAFSTAPLAFSSARKPARATPWSATPCCCRPLRLWSLAARCLAAGGAAHSALWSGPTR
jgi:ABC-type xylose transport system permease subunit